MKFWILFTLLTTAFSSFADPINFGKGRLYPDAVTLETQLPAPQLQEYGECHVQAAVAAAEAACFRRTGIRFQISPAYLFYLHVRTTLADMNNDYFLTSDTQGQFSVNDAGDYVATLMRIETIT